MFQRATLAESEVHSLKEQLENFKVQSTKETIHSNHNNNNDTTNNNRRDNIQCINDNYNNNNETIIPGIYDTNNTVINTNNNVNNFTTITENNNDDRNTSYSIRNNNFNNNDALITNNSQHSPPITPTTVAISPSQSPIVDTDGYCIPRMSPEDRYPISKDGCPVDIEPMVDISLVRTFLLD